MRPKFEAVRSDVRERITSDSISRLSLASPATIIPAFGIQLDAPPGPAAAGRGPVIGSFLVFVAVAVVAAGLSVPIKRFRRVHLLLNHRVQPAPISAVARPTALPNPPPPPAPVKTRGVAAAPAPSAPRALVPMVPLPWLRASVARVGVSRGSVEPPGARGRVLVPDPCRRLADLGMERSDPQGRVGILASGENTAPNAAPVRTFQGGPTPVGSMP